MTSRFAEIIPAYHRQGNGIPSAASLLVYLPPYSPDLNPIEQMFAKLKAMLRKAAERSVDGIIKAIGHIIDTIDPDECRNYLRNSGYAST